VSADRRLETVVDDGHSLYVMVDTSPCQEPHYRARFSLDPSRLVLGTGESQTVFEALDGADSPLVKLELNGPEQGYEQLALSAKHIGNCFYDTWH
jgi:hypothetical protein